MKLNNNNRLYNNFTKQFQNHELLNKFENTISNTTEKNIVFNKYYWVLVDKNNINSLPASIRYKESVEENNLNNIHINKMVDEVMKFESFYDALYTTTFLNLRNLVPCCYVEFLSYTHSMDKKIFKIFKVPYSDFGYIRI